MTRGSEDPRRAYLARQRELLDRHHVELDEIVAKIRRANDAHDFRMIADLLLNLQALEEIHYASEEALMRAVRFDMAARHLAEHAQLIETLRLINQTILVENFSSVSPKIASHLESALVHMRTSDEALWAALDQLPRLER